MEWEREYTNVQNQVTAKQRRTAAVRTVLALMIWFACIAVMGLLIFIACSPLFAITYPQAFLASFAFNAACNTLQKHLKNTR